MLNLVSGHLEQHSVTRSRKIESKDCELLQPLPTSTCCLHLDSETDGWVPPAATYLTISDRLVGGLSPVDDALN